NPPQSRGYPPLLDFQFSTFFPVDVATRFHMKHTTLLLLPYYYFCRLYMPYRHARKSISERLFRDVRVHSTSLFLLLGGCVGDWGQRRAPFLSFRGNRC